MASRLQLGVDTVENADIVTMIAVTMIASDFESPETAAGSAQSQ
jgi:hypothetical protein